MDTLRDLKFHPDFQPRNIAGVQVALERPAPDRLWLRYMISAPVDELALPDPAEPARADDLWMTTCFELFLRGAENDSYVELNFSPSTEWAAYRFSAYRAGRTPLAIAPPRIELSAASDLVDAEVTIELPLLEWSIASLTAVIEEKDGAKSYWALAHPPEGPPDFHHPACFVLELPPTSAPSSPRT